MNSTHIVLMKNGMASKEKSEMLKKIEDVKGVNGHSELIPLRGSAFQAV